MRPSTTRGAGPSTALGAGRYGWWVVLAAAACGAGVVVLGAGNATKVDVDTAWVTRGSITHETVATGTLQALTTVDVGAQVSGVVQSVDADFDSVVRTGDIVARLDPAPFDAALAAARAAAASARAIVREKQAAEDATRFALIRAEQLASSGKLPRADLDAARVADEAALADIKSARSAADEREEEARAAALDLEHTLIRSPVDGVVLLRNVEVGQTLAASLQAPVLYRIAGDLRHLQLMVAVDESDIADVRAGEPATFTVEAYGEEKFQGHVSQVRLQGGTQSTTGSAPPLTDASRQPSAGATAPAASDAPPNVTSYIAVVDVANADERLRPGMTATVTLRGTHHEDVTRIPNAAFAFQPPAEAAPLVDDLGSEVDSAGELAAKGMREVWKYDGGRLTPIAVRVGLSGGGWTEVVAGPVKPDDQLATGVVARRVPLLSRLATWIP